MLGSGAESAYHRVLDRVLLPRLLARLEQQIREGIQRPDFLYEAVRVYLMLGKQGPMDRGVVTEWFALDWSQSFPGAVNQPGRDALRRHLETMLTGTLATYPLDGALVDEARRVFSRLPMAQRVYARLRPLAENTPAWVPAQPLGARASGARRIRNMGTCYRRPPCAARHMDVNVQALLALAATVCRALQPDRRRQTRWARR
jgi:type VI secretion system protein ImpL